MLFQSEESWAPVSVMGENRASPWVVLCDHATNLLPDWLSNGTLGLSATHMARHIAYDIGAAGVALHLADQLDATLIMANFSRLVVDPNRGLDDPTLIRCISDGTIVPGNCNLSTAARDDRIDRCYRPYHAQIARIVSQRDDPVIVSVHSFTPTMRNGGHRPWDIGLLFADDDRLSRRLLVLLNAAGGMVVGENQPYSGELRGDTIDQHGIRNGHQNTLIEIRNDLIERDEHQIAWAERLAALLPTALDQARD